LQTTVHVNSGARATHLFVSQEDSKTLPFYRTIRTLLALVFAFLSAGATAAPDLAQAKMVAQENRVDNSQMGAYRALAKPKYGLSEQIERATDDFLSLITDAKGKPPDPAKVSAAMNLYLEKAQLAD
jgi:hypothetical protein